MNPLPDGCDTKKEEILLPKEKNHVCQKFLYVKKIAQAIVNI